MVPPVRCGLRSLPTTARFRRIQVVNKRYFRQSSITRADGPTNPPPKSRAGAFIVAATAGAAAAYFLYPSTEPADSTAARVQHTQAEIKFEEPRKATSSREENRDLISSQHIQVKKSWEEPGVYAWGSNVGRVVAPDSDETVIKNPRRIAYFDGKLLRDIKLDKLFGAAISENGDLLQWGTGYSSTNHGPTPTLKGKDLIKLSITRDRVIALSSNGTIYSVPTSQPDANNKTTPSTSSIRPSSNYRILSPANLGWWEKVVDVCSGQEHCLALTSAGRVFSCAIGDGNFSSRGQLGIAIPPSTIREASNQFYKIEGLQNSKITKIAAGDYHSLLLDTEGNVFSFGDNSSGQLGFEDGPDIRTRPLPSIVPSDASYKNLGMLCRVTDIAAGGLNSFFAIEATSKTAGQGQFDQPGASGTTVDIWACGQGIAGTLGNGRWTHVQSTPTKVKALSGLREYDEAKSAVVPIRVSNLSVGATHACAVLGLATNLGANSKTSMNDTNFGADVLWWGGNEFYQLGTGKRNNVNSPTYIPPLEIEAQDGEKGKEYRFQMTPRTKISVGGRKVSVEQRIECGKGASAVYSGT